MVARVLTKLGSDWPFLSFISFMGPPEMGQPGYAADTGFAWSAHSVTLHFYFSLNRD